MIPSHSFLQSWLELLEWKIDRLFGGGGGGGGGSTKNIVYVTATGVTVNGNATNASPYNASPSQTVVCLTGLGGDGSGNVTVNLPAGMPKGFGVEIKHDESTSLATHTFSVKAPIGVALGQPPPNNMTLSATGATLVFGNDGSGETNGMTLAWVAGDPVNNAYLLY